jgi:sugar phosphate isomerase/epimerase
MIDPLHLSRSGGMPSDLDTVRERIFIAQLCDATDPMPATRDARIAESRTARLFPGQGNLPLFDFLDRLPAVCELEIEAPHPDDVGRSPKERARRAARAFTAFLAGYAEHRPLDADVLPC